MKLKRTVLIYLIAVSISNSQLHIYANTLNSMEHFIKFNKTLVNDVQIKYLHENTTFYLNADMFIEGIVNEDATNKDILWKINDLDNKSNVIGLDVTNNKAKLIALSKGRAEVVAMGNDTSQSSRHITVTVKDYSDDDPNKSFVSSNIIPIQKRPLTLNRSLLQVEVNRNINYKEKIDAIDSYLDNLSSMGNLTINNNHTSHEDFDFFTININNNENMSIEIRVDKNDNSYDYIKDKLTNSNISKPNPEEIPLPEVPEIIKPNSLEKITILGGEGSKDNPLRLEANKNLQSEEKINAMKSYLDKLQERKYLEVISISESDTYTSYKIKVSNKALKSKNDFYIEIIVDKEDEKSYKPIITMLNNLNEQENNKENQLEEHNDIIQDNEINSDKNEIYLDENNISNNKVELEAVNSNTNSILRNDNKLSTYFNIEIPTTIKNNTFKELEINKSNDKSDTPEMISNKVLSSHKLNTAHKNIYVTTALTGVTWACATIWTINKRKIK